ncbi:MAG: hypothetical protein A3D92_19420 [Bacteroidetes bacterium RIFCSPHIGHO2_02_FULL_44_7]|nr:MAG: hypothetical protein A3D92_19420 [Bacteroidetes bacterium RIFCSPHIGHO2_02_FULL_44_7]
MNSPSITQSAGDERCASGVVNLSATSSVGTTDWYDAAVGGTFLATGNTYAPTISVTTTFYAEANLGGGCVSPSRTAVLATVDNVNIGVTQTAFNELTADQSGATYQWIDCATSQPIAGETNQTFTATQDGSYAVSVSLGVCDELSACTDLLFAGLAEHTTDFISVYPNPTTGSVTIDLSNVEATTITIFNALGNEVHRANCTGESVVVDMKNHASGVYLVQVETNMGTVQQRIVKQ